MPSCFRIYGASRIRIRIHAYVLLFFICVQYRYTFTLGEIQKSVFMFREPNVTNVKLNMYNKIPYEDCRCNVVPVESCLTDEELKYSRIIPLILFLLQIYLLKDILSLHQDRRYSLLNLYWIVSMFVFFCFLIIIYRSSYYYSTITRMLVCTGQFLFLYSSISQVIS
ncbi:unnamed protein product [Rotaria sp. Silwood2]|nr:unnamed protein product [Rotaria sp. Silwood2]CAF2896929.1 unnamed protein product [Rotaria sp. Silwood2]CAF4432016.1 unnamed protein product [Rotaria sp. Silwood2]CAF4526570.1 unnamed protein product [Rotaria sp. Silwood2]